MTFINPTICELAIALSVASISLQVVAALARSRSAPVDEPAEPPVGVESFKPLSSDQRRASLRMTHKELRQMAQDLQVGSGHFRSRAKKIELVQAIRAHQEAA
ncbi:hypothetical protein ACLM45_12955 [Synechococcus sp. A10-1-5-9]|uniref:hypothetical protein n=1 Tax=Synechococcus sp. A10-1-5-9 TaxID=3392295 RepID=UPI0039EC267F